MADDNKKPDQKPGSDSLEDSSTIIEPDKPAVSEEQPSTTAGTETPAAAASSAKAGRFLKLRRFISSRHLYMAIFLLLIIVASVGVFAAIQLSKDKDAADKRPQSLTDQQLAELKGSTTIIGNSQQVLDIQSNAVFQGQVLVRNNLDVAGTVKVGGPLSLSAVSVGGTSTFGQVQINDTLTVAGTTTLQRGLAVAGTGSFAGTLSANQINVTTLNLNGDLTLSRHIGGGGGTPGRTNGSALGGGGTASVSGTDTAGTVTINTGSGPPAGCFITVNFTRAYSGTPHVIISPSNSSSSSLNYYTNRSAGNFSICTTSTPAASTTFLFDYIVFD